MDRRYIRDNQVIERYLKGTLTADEERAFEELYLGDPDLLDEIQLVERLGQGLKDLGATDGNPARPQLVAQRATEPAMGGRSLAVGRSSLAVSGFFVSREPQSPSGAAAHRRCDDASAAPSSRCVVIHKPCSRRRARTIGSFCSSIQVSCRTTATGPSSRAARSEGYWKFGAPTA